MVSILGIYGSCNVMKKLLLLFSLVILLTGCSVIKEEKICTLDYNYGTYSGLHIITMFSKDGEFISNLSLQDRYNASFEDTDLSGVRAEIKDRQNHYLNDYQDATSEYSENHGFIAFSTNLPLNGDNVELFLQEIGLTGDSLLIDDYQTYLENHGYVCEEK